MKESREKKVPQATKSNESNFKTSRIRLVSARSDWYYHFDHTRDLLFNVMEKDAMKKCLSLFLYSALFVGASLIFAEDLLAGESKGSYIPEPIPVKSDIEITALYYPGTEWMPEWDMVKQTRPHIKPLLGWYDEGNPEAIDWQIKWAVEHGITAFFVDWYWNMGEQRLDHWVKGFYKAKFRSYMKWAMMWANHNQPGAHTTRDFRNIMKFWIDNYFKTPEYYKIDGKPVVQIFKASNIDRDMIAEAAQNGEKLEKGEGLKRAIDFCDQLAKDAGLKGIYFMEIFHGAYKYKDLKKNQIAGIHETSVYAYVSEAYWRHPNREKYQKNHFPYDLVVDTIEPFWQERLNACPERPFMPLIPTGWNCQPRTFENARIIDQRTPEKFKKICQLAKDFCEKNKIKRVILGPVNEWQEGSYIEPNEEFGFGMYDALRDVFCKKPEKGWPANLTPKDVGRGPYDFPAMEIPNRTKWTFDKTTEGWYRQPYGAPTLTVKNGKLTLFRTMPDLTAMRVRVQPFAAEKFTKCVVRMKIKANAASQLTGKEQAQIIWGSTTDPLFNKDLVVQRDQSSVLPVKTDDQFHDYVFPVSGNSLWKGKINEIWFNPINLRDAEVEIDSFEFK